VNHPSRRNRGPAAPPASQPAPTDELWSDRLAALAEANRGNRVVNPRPYNSRRVAPSLDDRAATTSGGAR
jgi:hypothetical protein